MSVIAVERRARARTDANVLHAVRVAQRRRYLTNIGAVILGIVLVIWSVLPIYNMIMVSLDSHSDVFSTHLFPPHPSVDSYWLVVTQGFWYLQYFWEQFGRSVFLAAMTVIFTLSIGSFAAFSVGRLRVRHGWLVTNCALLTYVIPASFLAIPFYRLMAQYGMMNNLWAVIAALVAFATPYAIFIFQQYGRSIPIELDEAARIDGASPIQIYFPSLSAADDAGAGRGRHLCDAAGVERVSLPVPAVVLDEEHDGADRDRPVPQQRPVAMELYDGHGRHLRAAAGRDLLRLPQVYGCGLDDGRRQGLSRRR